MIFFLTVALPFVLGEEGKLSDQKADPGRLTFKGITQATLDYARTKIAGLPASVTVLSDAEIATIYQVLFFNEIGGESLPDWAALALFDAAVNSGPETAAKWLQAALMILQDGHIGPETIAALKVADPHRTLRAFSAQRAFHFMRRPPAEIAVDGLGWGARLMLCHDTAAALIPPI